MGRDPRLRLLGDTTGTSPVVTQVLELLDATRIVIRSGTDMTGSHTAALAAFIGLAARLFGDIQVSPPVRLAPNWWGAPDSHALIGGLGQVRPTPAAAPTREIVVTFGDTEPGDLGIGGDDYTLRLGRHPQPLGVEPTHSLGVHGGASLAISQLLGIVLEPAGYPTVRVQDDYVTNLIDYRLTAAPLAPDTCRTSPLAVAIVGVGSVGTSTAALLAGSLSPGLSGRTDAAAGLRNILTVDADTIDLQRNPFRYPALTGTESGNKAAWIAHRLAEVGLPARGVPRTVADWTHSRTDPGFDGLIVSSVDTLAGRMDVTDVLARQTLSMGVSGLALHAQREGFADGLACPFCDYVHADPPLTQAGVHAETTGLSIARVLALLQPGAALDAQDLDLAISAGRLPPDRREALVGAPLMDLVRQAYAEQELRPTSQANSNRDVIAVAAPQVSWYAGVLAAVEVVKQVHGLPLLDRRVDADLTGLPPGLVRRRPADDTGRCLCNSGIRRRWHRKLFPPAS